MRHLRFIATACITALIGIAATTVLAQDTRHKDKDKDHTEKPARGFCQNNNWSHNDNISVAEVREMTISAGSLNVDGGQNGGISVKGEDRSDILVKACVQAWRSTEEESKAAAASVKISTNGTIKAEGPDDKKWSVSYQILAPRGTSLNLKAHNGGISISNIDGNAEFETLNGGVSITNAAGNYRGRTTNGGVNVKLAGSTWKGTGLDVQTTNGGINLTMPENYAAQIETGTVNGGYTTDIRGLEVEKPVDRSYGHRATKIKTAINGGGAPIRVITTNGGVRINSLTNE